jgi:hypothetical protein
MNARQDMEGDYRAVWDSVAHDLSSIPDGDALRHLLEPAVASFHDIPPDQLPAWLSVVLAILPRFDSAATLSVFLSVLFQDFSTWLMASPAERLDSFISFTAVFIDSAIKIDFVSQFAHIIPGFFPDPTQIDLNFLLGLQAPIFSYAVSRHPDSEAIYTMWFHGLACSLGAEIFRDNLASALAYFKLMNHAFFQVSVTGAAGDKQDPLLVTAQDAMRGAVVAISQNLFS